LAWLGIAGIGAATLAGLLAPFFPYLDLANHFRLFWLAGSLAVVAAAWPSGRARGLSLALLGANGVLAALPLALAASGAAASPTLRVATFNVWVGNPTPEAVVAFLEGSGADVVVLQEVDARLERAIVPALSATYPHAVSCARVNCGLVLLARAAPVGSGFVERSPEVPPMVWASFARENGQTVTVTGIHLAFPFEPESQARHVRALAEHLNERGGTQIVAGDFNLTPFSWKLNWLGAATGFRRHATFGFSWPARRFPVVLLDNLLATPDLRPAGYGIAPSGHGSDHRPVVFDLAFE